jgi:mono/diheme cytochrome c family protein
VLAVCALALVLAACGGGRPQTSATGSNRGSELFQRNCAKCHTLNAPTSRSSGGDLAETVLPVSDLVSFERIMPVKLTPAQLDAVARYVRAIEVAARRAKRH